MIGAFNKLVKRLVGDKSATDQAAVQPMVDATLALGGEFAALDSDVLRARGGQLRERIASHILPLQQEIEKLQTQASNDDVNRETLSFEQKEALYEQIDLTEKKVDEELEVVLEEVLPEAFALMKETAVRFTAEEDIVVTATEMDREIAARRHGVTIEGDRALWSKQWKAAGTDVEWNMVHYDVQLIGGVALHRGQVAEMQTGEGKTLVATLPVFLNALAGRGVHLVTVNDYLARRDSEWMGPIYEFHGLTVDCIDKHQPGSESRREAYRSDIVFGTNNEFGFDYLRDNMAMRTEQLVQRSHNYAIVDEVDSVLIDEARTPLIISGPTPKGDEHEFAELKVKVEQLLSIQRKAVTGFLTEAKRILSDENADKNAVKEGGLALYRAFRGLPKSKALIKFLSLDGMRQQLLKTEGF